MKYVIAQPSIMAYGGYDLKQLSDEEILEIANNMLFALKLSLEKINKKRQKNNDRPYTTSIYVMYGPKLHLLSSLLDHIIYYQWRDLGLGGASKGWKLSV